MRKLPVAVLLLLAVTSAGRAGVYHLTDPDVLWKVYGGPPRDGTTAPNDPRIPQTIALVEAARKLGAYPQQHAAGYPAVLLASPDRLFALRKIAVEPDPTAKLDEETPRLLCLRQVEYFEQLALTRRLDPVEAVGLSACYLRLAPPRGLKDKEGNDADHQQYRKKARRVLEALDRGHFLVQAALASVYQLDGNLDRAIECQNRALDLWPKVWAGWTPQELAFYQRCEQLQQKLLQIRQASAGTTPRGGATLDPLFPFVPQPAKKKGRGTGFGGLEAKAPPRPADTVRFVNEEGRYAAGELAAAEAAKMPSDGASILLQITFWQPTDQQLCWLLAEVYNAMGLVEPAERLLTSIVGNDGLQAPDLRQHQLILSKALPLYQQLGSRPNPALGLRRGELLSADLLLVLPRTNLGAPVVGDAASAWAALTPETFAALYEPPPPPPQQQDGPATTQPALPFNVQHVVVSFVFGVLVAALIGLQWQALRRRRPTTASPMAAEQRPAAMEAITAKSEGVMQQAPRS